VARDLWGNSPGFFPADRRPLFRMTGMAMKIFPGEIFS
jgi:hypothetical protein